MYSPKFTITNDILKNVASIEASREVVENAPLIPSFEKRFQNEAMLRTVYHGTHIEGNELTLSEAKRVLEGESIVARDRDIQEVINYRNVSHKLDSFGKLDSYGTEVLTGLHELTTQRILTPEKVGKIRQTQVVVKDALTGEITFRPPTHLEVPFLISEFFAWLNSDSGWEVHPVLRAGIAHYVLVAIHPFVEGNGRVARAFATCILFNEGYDIKKLFSIEEYFDRDAELYYEALQAVSSSSKDLASRDLTPWLSYFTKGLAIELTRIKDQVKRISIDVKIKARVGRQLELSSRQVVLMEYFGDHQILRRQDAKRLLSMISEDTILRELQDLVKKGIIKKEGVGRGARYRLKT